MRDVVRKMLALLSAKEKIQLLFIFVAIVLMAFVEMAGIASIMPFMSIASNPEMVETSKYIKQVYYLFGFSNRDQFLVFLGVIVLLLMVFGNIFKAMTTWMTLKYDNRLNFLLARRLLAKYLAQPYVFYLNRNTADMGKNILVEVRTVIAGILSPSMQICSNVLVCLCILVLLLIVNPVIAVTIATVLGGTYALIYAVVRRFLVLIGKEQVEANFMKYKTAGEALSGIKDLKILGRERFFLEKFSDYAQCHARNNAFAGTVAQLPRFFLEIIAFGGILLILLYFIGAEKGFAHIVPLLALYAFAGYRLLPALQQIFANVTTVRSNLPTLDILHHDLVGNSAERLIALPERAVKPSPLPFKHSLTLQDVSFRYPGTHRTVLQGVRLDIVPNTTVGFVGSTGSGKTTMIDVILGLLFPTSGKLMIDDVIVDQNNFPEWRLNLGYVPQYIYLCDDTITSNIAFGVPHNEIDMTAVVRAATIANLHKFIEADLEQGYETIIGERGVRLSGGQRQRIGIARALYHDPALLVLDEATSALDNLTEEAVMEAIHNLSRKKTIVIVAHRLTTVKNCDMIFLLEQGQIKDQGTYNELLNSSEWFRVASKETE